MTKEQAKPNPALVAGSGSWKKLSGGVKVATALKHGVKVSEDDIYQNYHDHDVEGAIGEKGLLEETKGRCQCAFCFWEQEGEEEGRETTEGARK